VPLHDEERFQGVRAKPAGVSLPPAPKRRTVISPQIGRLEAKMSKVATTGAQTWKQVVGAIVQSMDREFTLTDVLAYRDELKREFPNNHFIDAKVRQSLQILRDQGLLQFVSPGNYRRLDAAPMFSPLIDLSLAARYTNGAQAARVALETWASFNLYCLTCESDAIDRLSDNTPVADFQCFICGRMYQLKGKNGRFGPRITGAAYRPTLEAVRNGSMPEYVLVEFDMRFGTVVFVDAIPGHLITKERIVPRKPLAETARRAGWQGCNIVVSGLPSVRIVAPAGLERSDVRERWHRLME
jgi:hypothetical protein